MRTYLSAHFRFAIGWYRGPKTGLCVFRPDDDPVIPLAGTIDRIPTRIDGEIVQANRLRRLFESFGGRKLIRVFNAPGDARLAQSAMQESLSDVVERDVVGVRPEEHRSHGKRDAIVDAGARLLQLAVQIEP